MRIGFDHFFSLFFLIFSPEATIHACQEKSEERKVKREEYNKKNRQLTCVNWRFFLLAGDEGFEPSQTESESGVLPLHKSPSNKNYYTTKPQNVNTFFRKFRKNFIRNFLVRKLNKTEGFDGKTELFTM